MDPKTPMPREAGEDPFGAMRREMDRLFDEMTRSVSLARPAFGTAATAPRVDLRETDGALVVEVELPGVSERDVEVQLAPGVLTIRGEKKPAGEDKGYYLMERAFGSFQRQIPLPLEVDEDAVEAGFDRGVLTVRLPRSARAEARPKTIAVKPAG